MFESLQLLTQEQAKLLVSAFECGESACVLIDPTGVCILIRPNPTEHAPHRIHFLCATKEGDTYKVAGLTAAQYAVVEIWMKKTTALIGKVWNEMYPLKEKECVEN